jgi:hypothetical protein
MNPILAAGSGGSLAQIRESGGGLPFRDFLNETGHLRWIHTARHSEAHRLQALQDFAERRPVVAVGRPTVGSHGQEQRVWNFRPGVVDCDLLPNPEQIQNAELVAAAVNRRFTPF